jgi:anti-sigma regulatory factor (Ser/Thr protein kinase)
MTSQGNEEIAVEALRGGAASYVPKVSLASSLPETVEEVLDLASSRLAEKRLQRSLARSESEFVLENDLELIRPLVRHLEETLAMMGLCDEAECLQVGVAIYESLTNALEHGNLGLTSEERTAGPRPYGDLVRERSREAPYRDRRIHVTARLDREEACFVVRDEGDGFDPTILPDPRDPSNLGKLSGRGIMLIRSFMDDVTFNDVGNQITMVKRREPEQR